MQKECDYCDCIVEDTDVCPTCLENYKDELNLTPGDVAALSMLLPIPVYKNDILLY